MGVRKEEEAESEAVVCLVSCVADMTSPLGCLDLCGQLNVRRLKSVEGRSDSGGRRRLGAVGWDSGGNAALSPRAHAAG